MSHEKMDENFELRVLACLWRSKDFATVAHQHLKPGYFVSPVRHNMVKMALDFFDKYQTLVTPHAFAQLFKELVDGGKVKKEEASAYTDLYRALQTQDISDYAYVLDLLIRFIKDREIRKLIEQAVKNELPKGNFTAIEKAMQDILGISATGEATPVDYWSDEQIDARQKRREDSLLVRTMGISTGIKMLDDALDKKGWYKKELYLAVGKAKFGKTMFMLWCANAASWQGFNAAYFTCETSEERLADRMDAMNSNVEIRFLPEKCKEVAAAIKAKKPTGKVFTLEYPTKTLTAAEIERQLKRFEMKGVRIDFVVVDYAGLMRSVRHYNERMDEDVAILEELRRIATKFEIPLLTAGQTNKQGAQRTITSGIDLSGKMEQVAVVDGCLTLCGSDKDLKKGEMLIHLSEFRNTATRTLRVRTSYGMGKFYKEYVGEEETA